jgi:hypothetical protein
MLDRLGKYEVKKLLGKGATGSVYLAADPFAQREVALKVMDNASADPEEARRQLRFFQTEAALAGKLRHPHIVSILDAGVEDPSGAEPLRYLVMELVQGSPLATYCDPSDLLDPSRIVEIIYKCCKALEFANTLGVVHRDIKPANILVKDDYDIKVSDFGAAQVARADVTQVSGVGSPFYMSPEQIRGDDEIGWQSDMFSLGGVLYHMLTGRRPFAGKTAYELMEAIMATTPPPPSKLRPEAPGALDAIVARAMAKSPRERFASWEEFGGAIGALLRLDSAASELSDAERFAASRRLKFFRHFADAELWEVVRASKWRLYPAGAELIREGSHDEHFYVVASGLLKVTQRGKLLNAVSPGECVGEMAYARRDGLRSATVAAVEPSWAMGLRVQDVDTLSDHCRARFNEAFLVIMADRLAMLGGRLLASSQERAGVV